MAFIARSQRNDCGNLGNKIGRNWNEKLFTYLQVEEYQSYFSNFLYTIL